jgi:predicted dehydrogenase
MFEGEVLVVGLGSIGERHVRNLHALGQRDITVLRRASTPPRTLDGTEYQTITDVDEAFTRRPIAVIIAAPTALHAEFLERAIELGAAVLVEVPLAHALTDLQRLAQRATETGARILIGHNLRFHPSLRSIRAAVRAGAVGQPLYSRAQFGEYLPDCHPWQDYRDRYEARADLGGGVILTSIHEIDNAFWLFGPVEAVTCVARRRELNVDVEDVAMIVLEHTSEVLSAITLDFVQRTYRRNLQIAGREGTIEWDFLDDHVKVFTSKSGDWTELFRLEDYDVNETYLDELRHFARVASAVEEPLTNLDAGIHVLRVALDALESSTLRCRVETAI